MGMASVFVNENRAKVLRNLIGRTVTVLHTVGSRHSIENFYVDIFIDEKQDEATVEDVVPYMGTLPLALERLYVEVGDAGCKVCLGDGEDMTLERMRDAVRTGHVGTGRGGTAWTWESTKGWITDGVVVYTPDAFVSHFSTLALRQRAENEQRYREKCVHGRYVPSPELRRPPPRWADVCDD